MQTSEYVSLGHPDKIADYISEYILDRLIEQDKKTRYALEVQIKDNHVCLGGEITTRAKNIDFKKWTVKAIKKIGYNKEYYKIWGDNTINPDAIKVDTYISCQSPDIAKGVNRNGWGDQGIMHGMATPDQQTNMMPKDHWLAKTIGQTLYQLTRDSKAPWGLDIKTQVTYDDKKIVQVIVAAPCEAKNTKILNKTVKELILQCDKKFDGEIIVNGTGAYKKHASIGDCGTTGRKLAVDFYGGNCIVGGGSPWTKDGTKADLALNLYARSIAVNKATETGKTVYTSVSCCIGKPDIFVTIKDKRGTIAAYKEKVTPAELIKRFRLDKPIFANLCEYGLFGETRVD